MKSYIASTLILLLGLTTVWGQQTPAVAQSETISITGATLHLGNGEIVENGTVTFTDGTITAIGAGLQGSGRVIDATGKHVYPGFIAPGKSLGLIEIEAVRASNDQDEIGSLIPHVRSIIAYNAESQVVESMRPNGVLLGQIAPKGGRISGTSSIVQFDAWNWEDAIIKEDDGIHLHWPESFRRGRWWMGEPRGYQPNSDYETQKQEVLNFISSSKVYGAGKSEEINPAFRAMQGLFTGDKTLYLYANGEQEIVDGVSRLKDAGMEKIVLVGGYEAYKVTDLLKSHGIPVLVNFTHTLPNLNDDAYDLPYRLPKMLDDAGLLVGIQNAEDSNFATRNLPFYAGQVVGQGMDKEKALAMITGNTARILGIDDQYGTLASGKSATLFISEGDALDMRGNQLTHAFIDGRELSLETHQTELWKRYMGKFARE
ncbi:amidohydrolase family protein [Robiginitalea sp.]|uniref:amidohydrolase family protein n=1 Tax=Robiginitalea sp. TaxID=1902411 RepID=UPI003C781E4B